MPKTQVSRYSGVGVRGLVPGYLQLLLETSKINEHMQAHFTPAGQMYKIYRMCTDYVVTTGSHNYIKNILEM